MAMRQDIGTLIRRLGHNTEGVAAVEFAIILPAMLIMYFGTFEVSQLLRAYMATNRAAQLIANLVAQDNDSVTASDSADYCTAASLAMSPFSGASLKATISSITKNTSNGAIAFDWTDTSCNGGAGVFLDATTAANGLLVNNGDSVIVVKVQYGYTGKLHFVLPSNYTIVQTSYQRPRTTTPVTHS